MSDQNVITDYRAYFASLGPGRQFTADELLAMVSGTVEVILIADRTPGSILHEETLSLATCLDEALEMWVAWGKPRMWLQLCRGTAPWFVDSGSLPTRGKVRSKA